VPPVIIPFLLLAVKAYKKYTSLQHKLSQEEQNNVHHLQEDGNGSTVNGVNNERAGDDSIQEAIFARMDSNKHKSGPLHAQQQETQQAINSLLSELSKNSADSLTATIDDEDLPTSCAIGCLDFVMDLIKDDTAKIILRHAAVCVSHALLQNRNDCRIVFTKRIKEFVDAIGDADNHMAADNRIGKTEHVVMYQKEGLKLVHSLSDRFTTIQPTLVIASRYLEEQKGISLFASSQSSMRRKTNAGMIELRRIRDVAIKCAEKECGRVNKILKKMDSCFDILVPRFGHRFNSNLSGVAEKAPGHSDEETDLIVVDEEDDSDDGIAWEDGDEGNDDDSEKGDIDEEPDRETHEETEDHLSAVERTLAVMQQSRALQNDGTLDVMFGADAEDSATATTTVPADTEQPCEAARELLSKCVAVLTKRHERLSLWIDALMSADNMTDASRIITSSKLEQSRIGASSVIILPESIRKKKGPIKRLLIDIKGTATKALSAAGKIGINAKSVQNNDTTGEGAPNNGSEKQQEGVMELVETPFPATNNSLIQPWQDVLGVKPSGSTSGTKQRLASSFNQRGHASFGKKKAGRGRLQIKLRKS